MLNENTILYKYRCDNPYTEDIFKKNKIYLCPSKNLNDTFECEMQEIAETCFKKHVDMHMHMHLMSSILLLRREVNSGKKMVWGIPSDIMDLKLKEFEKCKKIEEAYELLRTLVFDTMHTQLTDISETLKNFEQQLHEVGIFSLTESAENELMWAHYGNYSKGIALGFKATKGSKLLDCNNCFKVEYSDLMPEFTEKGFCAKSSINFGGKNVMKVSFSDKTFQKIFCSKSVKWKYEDEWRYVEESNGEFDFPGELSEIVFGLRCPQEIREKYVDMAKQYIHNDINYFEIQAVPKFKRIKKVQLKIR